MYAPNQIQIMLRETLNTCTAEEKATESDVQLADIPERVWRDCLVSAGSVQSTHNRGRHAPP
jgi:hypothetical protein